MSINESSSDMPGTLSIDYESLNGLFSLADVQGRDYLFEYETYELLKRSGAETPPQTSLLVKGSRPSDDVLMALPGNRVVLKIVSPTIIHKTEVGGVKVVEKRPDKIRSAWRRMMVEVPEAYAAMIERDPSQAAASYCGFSGEGLKQAIVGDIRGILMVQFMPPDSEAFGNEMIVGIRNSREFGMSLTTLFANTR